MAKLDLTKYGITGTTEIVYNPSYEQLFEEETKPGLEGYEKGQVSELGAVNVMTGIPRPPLRIIPPNGAPIKKNSRQESEIVIFLCHSVLCFRIL